MAAITAHEILKQINEARRHTAPPGTKPKSFSIDDLVEADKILLALQERILDDLGLRPQGTKPAKKAKKKKAPSRADRWAEAVGKAKDATSAMLTGCDEVESAIEELKSLKEEYETWKDNLGDNFQNTPVAEKLDAVCDLDIDDLVDTLRSAVEEADGKLDEAENLDLPLGFGRD